MHRKYGAHPACRRLPLVLGALLCSGVIEAQAPRKTPVTIEDDIAMVRIHPGRGVDEPTVVFSDDGRWFVAVLWRGDLSRNLNRYTLLLHDAANLQRRPVELLTVDDPSVDPSGPPLSQPAFLASERLTALASLSGGPPQAVAIDLATRAVTPLTRHPSAVLAFAAQPAGGALVYAVHVPDEAGPARRAALIRDGFSLEDRRVTRDQPLPLITNWEFLESRRLQYFLIGAPGANPRKIYDGPDGSPTFWMSPDGRYAVVHPYVAAPESAPTFGLIDMTTGATTRLLPTATPSSGRVLWARDGKSLIVQETSGNRERVRKVLHAVDVASRRVTSVEIGPQWELLGWPAVGEGVLLTRAGRTHGGDPEHTLATLRRTAQGWGALTPTARADSKYELNLRYHAGTNGRLIVGVKDGLMEPPELAAYDRDTRRTQVLTDLNPHLRERTLGAVTRLRWSGPYDTSTSLGYLIKPVGYEPGRRYPAIVQFKDESYFPEDDSFILGATWQRSGAAIQVWANAGFVVLFTPWPGSTRAVMETPREDEYVAAHIESGLDLLEAQGLIDRNKVAITGFSRAGWMTEYVVAHAKTRFAAATNIDNVSYNAFSYALRITGPGRHREQWGGLLPWGETAALWRQRAIDFKFDQARTPRLIEVHGMAKVVMFALQYAAYKTANIPVDFYVYPEAPHDLVSPRHRQRSLGMHTDWFRFWLQDHEDPDPTKQAQYARWRAMRQTAQARSAR